MQKIFPHLWFNKEASEAAAFYISVFPESKITASTMIYDTPSGDCEIITFELWKQKFMAISAGPLFTFNPSVSFMVNFEPVFFKGSPNENAAAEQLEKTWNRLAEGGKVLMPLDEYPFSKKYGWVEDKYGLTWQLILTNSEGDPRPPIIPALMFTGKNAGRAEEAVNFYLSVFKNTQKGNIHFYPEGDPHNSPGSVMFADYMLEGCWFAIMDSAFEHKFNFNEAISFIINCNDQAEIDYYWNKLSAVPESEQCGWLKDKFSLSWQVSPEEMEDMLNNGSRNQVENVTKAFLPMKKLEIQPIRKAFYGSES